MNILFIAIWDPRNIQKGGEQRTHLLWNTLKGIGQVKTIVVGKHDNDLIEETDDIRYFRFQRRSPRWLYRPILTFLRKARIKTGLSLIPYISVCPKVEDIYPEEKFDCIVVRYVKTVEFVDFYRMAPVYVDIDDYPLTFFDTLIAPEQVHSGVERFFWRCFVKLELWVLEHFFWQGTWVADASDLGKVGARKHVELLENIALYQADVYKDVERHNCLITVGNLSFAPNKSGISNFLENIWGKVHESFPELEYWIVGREASEEDIAYWSNCPGVRFIGPVEDISSAYGQCLAAVIPIDAGAGTCIKTIEALAHYRVCLSTVFGARGLTKDRENTLEDNGVMLYHDADDFMSWLKIVIFNEPERIIREHKAKDYINRHYSRHLFESHVRALLGVE